MSIFVVISWITFLATIGLASRLTGSIFSVPSAFGLAWVVPSLAATILSPNHFTGAGLALITLLMSTVLLGYTLNGGNRTPTRGPLSITLHSPARVRFIMTAACAAPLVGLALSLTRQGIAIGSLDSAAGLADASNNLSVARYGGQTGGGPVSALLLLLTYSGCILSGLFLGAGYGRPGRIPVGGPLMSTWLFSLVTTARAVGLVASVLFFGAWISMRIHRDGSLPSGRAHRKSALFALSALLSLSFTAAFLRLGPNQVGRSEIALAKSTSVLVLGASGNDWWANDWFGSSKIDPLDVPVTFAGVTSQVFGAPKQGIYPEFLELNEGTRAKSNLFGSFRGVFEDFGTAIAFIFFLTVGLLGGHLVTRLRTSTRMELWVVLSHAAIVSWITFSPLVSLFAYSSPMGAFAVAALGAASLFRLEPAHANQHVTAGGLVR